MGQSIAAGPFAAWVPMKSAWARIGRGWARDVAQHAFICPSELAAVTCFAPQESLALSVVLGLASGDDPRFFLSGLGDAFRLLNLHPRSGNGIRPTS